MTFDEALRQKIYKLRLSHFKQSAYVDPRTVEYRGLVAYVPIIDPINPELDHNDKPYFCKVMLSEDFDTWEVSD